jgi:hypothetical protein
MFDGNVYKSRIIDDVHQGLFKGRTRGIFVREKLGMASLHQVIKGDVFAIAHVANGNFVSALSLVVSSPIAPVVFPGATILWIAITKLDTNRTSIQNAVVLENSIKMGLYFIKI